MQRLHLAAETEPIELARICVLQRDNEAGRGGGTDVQCNPLPLAELECPYRSTRRGTFRGRHARGTRWLYRW